MDIVVALVTIAAMMADPLLLVLAAGLGYALRGQPVAGAIAAGVVIALALEALVVVLAADEYQSFRFGQSLLPRVVATVAATVGAWAAWRALRKPEPEVPSNPAGRP